ncbi:unnamed protein product [Lymnaea stagnalis]|uniref:Spermatogenesis-associated protein 1 C-terminal domain-containing protein n=1 Tax=Lymnaea stagnalis TaxID=6523 RepID=A0AAV2HGB5_LYMST
MSRNTLTNYNNFNSNRSSHQTLSQTQSQIIGPPSRPPSEQLCDLHVYKVPTELWRENLNNILNNVVTETVSVGIIRVPADLRLVDLREEIVNQLQLDELVPRDYVFLRSVGRSLTRLRNKQEYQLKAKHFVPPVAFAPELYILETTPEMRDAMAISDRSSQSPPISRRTSPNHRGYPFRNGYPGDSDNERNIKPRQKSSSPVHKYQPLPKISPDKSRDTHQRDSSPEPNHYNSDDSIYNKHNQPYNPYKPHNGKQNHNPHKNEGRDTDWDEQPVKGAKVYRGDRSPSPGKHGHPGKKESDPLLDNDSDVADDDYRRGVDHDNRLRKTQDLQRQINADRFGLEDETEEERRRRLEDLESGYDHDRQRWNADKEERRRRAQADRMKEEEEKRLRELEKIEREEFDKRQREEFEKKQREELERRKKEEERKLEELERKRREEEEKRHREEVERRKKEEEKQRIEEEKRQRKEEEKRQREEEERIQKEEAERRKKEDEKRRKEEEKRRKEEEEEELRREEEMRLRHEQEERERRQQKEAERQRNKDFNQFPPSPGDKTARDTESAKQRRRNEKNQLLKDIEEARQARQDQEKEREELVKRAKQMQHKTTNRRNEARDMWKKKYFEEKKKTAPLEENSNRLRQELEALHRKLMNTLEGPKERNPKLIDAQPSPKNNHIIQCTKLQHEIEDLQRRVENARMKLTAEMKLRNQAQGELRALRAELTQRKLSLERDRQHQLAALNPGLRGQTAGKEISSYNHILAPTSEYPRTSLEGF